MLLSNKKKLPIGIYVSEEFPPDIKKARDRLQPIFRLAKINPDYKDKCKMDNDKLIINCIKYSLNDLSRLPQGVEAYKTAEKSNSDYIAFKGEHSPYSNFHHSPFKLDGGIFESAEQWIQYQKSLLFHDTETAEQIMQSDSPYEIKQLSYWIRGFDKDKWHDKGYDICLRGIKAKFEQNDALLAMLKTTGPKILVEATQDHLWGTGVQLRDTNVLNLEKWHGRGWLSHMLEKVWDNS